MKLDFEVSKMAKNGHRSLQELRGRVLLFLLSFVHVEVLLSGFSLLPHITELRDQGVSCLA